MSKIKERRPSIEIYKPGHPTKGPLKQFDKMSVTSEEPSSRQDICDTNSQSESNEKFNNNNNKQPRNEKQLYKPPASNKRKPNVESATLDRPPREDRRRPQNNSESRGGGSQSRQRRQFSNSNRKSESRERAGGGVYQRRDSMASERSFDSRQHYQGNEGTYPSTSTLPRSKAPPRYEQPPRFQKAAQNSRHDSGSQSARDGLKQQGGSEYGGSHLQKQPSSSRVEGARYQRSYASHGRRDSHRSMASAASSSRDWTYGGGPHYASSECDPNYEHIERWVNSTTSVTRNNTTNKQRPSTPKSTIQPIPMPEAPRAAEPVPKPQSLLAMVIELPPMGATAAVSAPVRKSSSKQQLVNGASAGHGGGVAERKNNDGAEGGRFKASQMAQHKPEMKSQLDNVIAMMDQCKRMNGPAPVQPSVAPVDDFVRPTDLPPAPAKHLISPTTSDEFVKSEPRVDGIPDGDSIAPTNVSSTPFHGEADDWKRAFSEYKAKIPGKSESPEPVENGNIQTAAPGTSAPRPGVRSNHDRKRESPYNSRQAPPPDSSRAKPNGLPAAKPSVAPATARTVADLSPIQVPEYLDWSLEVEKFEAQEKQREQAAEKPMSSREKHTNVKPEPLFTRATPRPPLMSQEMRPRGGILHIPANIRMDHPSQFRVPPDMIAPPRFQPRGYRNDPRMMSPQQMYPPPNVYYDMAPLPPADDYEGIISEIQPMVSNIRLRMCQAMAPNNPSDLDRLMDIRLRFEQSLFNTIMVNLRHNPSIPSCKQMDSLLDQTLWKWCFHSIIDYFRNLKLDVGFIQTFLNQSIKFYTMVFEQLQGEFCFSLVDYFAPMAFERLEKPLKRRPKDLSSARQKLALVHCQRVMLYLGDLHRYNEQWPPHGGSNFGVARNWYLKGSQIAPSNGKAYNQLALLGTYARHRLDTVFYCFRAINARDPFDANKNVLLQAFQEIHKKVECQEQQMQGEIEAAQRRLNSRDRRNPATARQQGNNEQAKNRRETWVFPDGSTESRVDSGISEEATIPSMVDILQRMNTMELHRNFVLYFLYVTRTLSENIGFERFELNCEKALGQLLELIGRTESPLTALQLVQCSSIAITCVESQYAQASKSESDRKQPQHFVSTNKRLQDAFQFVLSYLAVLCIRLRTLLSDHLANLTLFALFSTELRRLLPAIRVLTHWLMARSEIYEALPDLNPVHCESVQLDLWSVVADLGNLIQEREREISGYETMPPDSTSESCFMVPEDFFLAGLNLAFSLKPDLFRATTRLEDDNDKVRICDLIRLSNALLFAEFLDGSDRLTVMKWSDVESKFVSTSQPETTTLKAATRVAKASESSEDVHNQSVDSVEGLTGDMLSLHVTQRDERQKERLLAQANDQNVEVELVICPVYLIIDTNTFLDHLPLVQRVMQKGLKYHVYVPLVVWDELLGLAQETNEWVGQTAAKAISYLKGEFNREDNRRLRTLTSQGTPLMSFEYGQTEEKLKQGERNDDRILNACVRMSHEEDKKRPSQQLGRGEPIRLQRSMVLITNDRNLRVKAISKDIPTKSIRDFVKLTRLADI